MNITPTKEQINKFSQIFNGSKTNRGQIIQNNTATVKLPFEPEKHLTGELPQGLSPNILDEQNKTAYANYFCCDLDLGYQSKEAGVELAKYLIPFDPELFIFKSKQKGYHIYKFLKKPYPADEVKVKAKELEKYLSKKYNSAVDTGHTLPASYHFEKTINGITTPDLSSGSWLNLPYYRLHFRKCLSLCGNYELTFDDFCLRYDVRHHKKLAALIGRNEEKSGRHDNLLGAAGYIHTFLDDDEALFKKIAASMGFTEHDWNSGGNISHQWKQRTDCNQEYWENYTFGQFKKIIGLPDYKDVKEDLETTQEEETFNVVEFDRTKHLHKRQWIMEKYLKVGNLTLMQGMGGAGKTQLLVQLAISFSYGFNFFGNQINTTGNSLLILAEEDISEAELRLRAAEQIYGINKTRNKIFLIGYDTNLKIVNFKYGGTSKGTKQYEKLCEFITKQNIKFIGLDPLISYQKGSFDENSNPQMDDFIKNYLIPIARDNDAAICATHHTNKISMMNETETSDTALYAGRGASSLGAAARIVIGVATMSKKLWEDEYRKILPDENDRFNYIALIDAKNNYAARNNIPLWVKKKEVLVECVDGFEKVNVFCECNLSELANKHSALRQEHDKKRILDLIQHIDKVFEQEQDHNVSVNSIAAYLTSIDPRLANTEEATLKQEYTRLIKGALQQPIEFKGFDFQYSYNGHLKVKHLVTKLRSNYEAPF
jgi:RecA-family ATPase